MKKNLYLWLSLHPTPKKLLMELKIASIIVVLSVTNAFAATSYSQSAKVTLDMENKTLGFVMDEIERQSEFYFIFNQKQIDVDRIVNVKEENKLIDEVLSKIFSGTKINYAVLDRKILLTTDPLENNALSLASKTESQQKKITGTVIDKNGDPIAGVNVHIPGTTQGAITDNAGKYSILIPEGGSSLSFSFIGMESQEIKIGTLTQIDVNMVEVSVGLDEVVVIGYGTQKRSDITGTVTSVPKERLEKTVNTSIAQTIQGSIPGVMMQTASAGAKPSEVIMIRGRNSITAGNNPLVIIDGIPGAVGDVNPNDVQSIEILKDASSCAIYGSRAANGVVLITTKKGVEGKVQIQYDGYYSIDRYSNLPDYMNGEEFYKYKLERAPSEITLSEQAIYDERKWVNWTDAVIQNGFSHEHNLSLSGGFKNTNYYFAGSLLDVQGLLVNDKYLRGTTKINLDSKIGKWLSIGTRTTLKYDDESGESPPNPYGIAGDASATNSDLTTALNPLTTIYDSNGKLTIYPWPEDTYWPNQLQATLYDNKNLSYTAITNNYAVIDFPFISGLSYRINTGLSTNFLDQATYRGRNTKSGKESNGSATTSRQKTNSTVIENILTYNRVFGRHSVFVTGLYSYENNNATNNDVSASNFPNDLLSWYAANQAATKSLSYSYNKTVLISQMIRLNYAYFNRYLLTLTFRRDGCSVFGADKKWALFPSFAFGWNINEENFFPWKDLFDVLKLRYSWGLNGNQAVNPFQSISRLSSRDYNNGLAMVSGYIPSVLGAPTLGWELSKKSNFGLDFGIFDSRISGDINYYVTNTSDLLLARTISAVHGIGSITQNIGKTQNKGLELSINSRNIVGNKFTWSTSGNIAFNKNKIVSLYGIKDNDGNEVDDIANKWFIGQPIGVNYDYVLLGVWQLDEAAEAAKWISVPGYSKIKDVNGDYLLTANDRQIIGQKDPKIIWGINNSLTYRNFKLDIFIHGVSGVTLNNGLYVEPDAETRRNVLDFNFWTPTNPTNDWCMNKKYADRQGGVGASGMVYQNASFVRLKDVTLTYDLPKNLISRINIDKLSLYIIARNLITLTEWTGTDPELATQNSVPMQKKFVFGLRLGF